VRSKKITTAGILALLTGLFSAGFNAILWLVITMFVGIGESLSGASNADGRLIAGIMIFLAISSFVMFVLSIAVLIKNKKNNIGKVFLIVFAVVLTMLVVVNVFATIKMIGSWAILIYLICGLINLIALVLTILSVVKFSKSAE